MATESFFEDLVIDTPEAAARFAAVLEENKPYVSNGTVFREATAEDLHRIAVKYGFKEL